MKPALRLCTALLGLLGACGGAALADGSVTTPHVAVTSPGGVLPSYVGSFTALYSSPVGYTPQDMLSVDVEVDYIWAVNGGVVLSASAYDRTQGLNYNTGDGGYTSDLSPATFPPSYGTQAQIRVPYAALSATPAVIQTAAAPYMIGMTVFKVHDAAGNAVPGAHISCEDYTRSGYGSGWKHDYAPLTGLRMVLGQGLLGKGDDSYPPGLATDRYLYTISAPGDTSETAYFATGTASGGQTVDVTLAPTGSPSSHAVAPTSAADNPDQPPGAIGGAPDPTFAALADFIAHFWEKFTALFVPDQASVDAFKAAAARLTSYGPFGLPAQLSTLFDHLLTSVDTVGAQQRDGTYWRWYLSRPPGFGGSDPQADPLLSTNLNFGAPLGYDTQLDHPAPAAPTIYDQLMPQYLDLTPFAGPLLMLRRLLLATGWLFFVTDYLRWLSPRPSI